MYTFEHHIRVMLEFRAMDEPVEITVPWNVLFYLDTHAERMIAPDGTVIYRNIDDTRKPAKEKTSPFVQRTPVLAA